MSGTEEDAIQLILKRVLDDQHDWSLDHSHKPGPIDSFAEAEAAITALLAEARKEEVQNILTGFTLGARINQDFLNVIQPMLDSLQRRIDKLAALGGKSDE